MRALIFILCMLRLASSAYPQVIYGKVIDHSTGEPLSFVRIGVAGKNVGTISRDNGDFEINTKEIVLSDRIVFSMVGYSSYSATLSEIAKDDTVRLKPTVYSLKEVTIAANEIVEMKRLGRPKPTRTTIGHSGTSEWGIGGEWGLRIPTNGDTLALQDVAFHTRFNTLDSVLFRISVYALEGDIPGRNLLTEDVYVTSHAKDKWISKDLSKSPVRISTDFAITVEIIRLWYRKGGDNHLFFTYGENPDNLPTFSRPSSHAAWRLNEMPPLALYVTARKLNE